MPSDDIDDSRVVKDVYVPSDIISVVEDSSITTLNEIHIFFEGISDVVDALLESNTPLPDDIYIHEDDTSESDALHLHVAHNEISRESNL